MLTHAVWRVVSSALFIENISELCDPLSFPSVYFMYARVRGKVGKICYFRQSNSRISRRDFHRTHTVNGREMKFMFTEVVMVFRDEYREDVFRKINFPSKNIRCKLHFAAALLEKGEALALRCR